MLVFKKRKAKKRWAALFDADYYLAENPDVAASGVEPSQHFLTVGWAEGRNPHPIFDTAWYFKQYPDVARAGANPLVHYVEKGWKEGRNPNPLFDTAWYLEQNPDVAASDVNPLIHFIQQGWREKRSPNPLFDTAWYLEQNPDVARAGENPLVHYVEKGWKEGRNPNPLFDTAWYLEQNPDVRLAGVEPLRHYTEDGWREGRNPSDQFNGVGYLKRYVDVASRRINPLSHFLIYGRAEGRFPLVDLRQDKSLEFDDSEPTLCEYFTPVGKIDAFEAWRALNDGTSVKQRLSVEISEALAEFKCKFSIIVPILDPSIGDLRETVNSLLSQTYLDWNLVLVNEASANSTVTRMVEDFEKSDSRIRMVSRETTDHISSAINSAADNSDGDFLVLLSCEHRLTPETLLLIALYICDHPDTDIIYSDEAEISAEHRLKRPQFKPSWSPELLLSYSYVSQIKAIRHKLYTLVDGIRIGFEGSDDYDLLLRASEQARHIGHVPQILCHRHTPSRQAVSAGSARPAIFEAGRRACEDAFYRRGISCRVEHPEWALRRGVGFYVPKMPHDGPSVAIVTVANGDRNVAQKIFAALNKAHYKNFHVYIIDDQCEVSLASLKEIQKDRVTILNPPQGIGTFDCAHYNKAVASDLSEEFILFLGGDIESATPEWLSQMVGWARLPGVGAVGAHLVTADGQVRHGKSAIGDPYDLPAIPGLEQTDSGNLWRAKVTRNVTAVAAAALITPRKLFSEMGGFDENHFALAHHDVDYCMKLYERGYRVVHCGDVELRFSNKPKLPPPSEVAAIRKKYGRQSDFLRSPHCSSADERIAFKPTVIPWVDRSKPLRVLAVTHNLNHEGAPNSAFELITGLQSRGVVNPHVVSPKEGPLRAEYEKSGINVEILPKMLTFDCIESIQDYDELLDRLIRDLQFKSYDLVYANTATTFWVIDAAARAGVPSVFNVRESESWKTYFSGLPTQVAERALEAFGFPYRVIFVANATRKRWEPIDRLGNFEVIHNGLDLRRRAKSYVPRDTARDRLKVSPEHTMVLALGTVAPRKGQHDLVEAVLAMPPEAVRKIRVFIVGARPSEYLHALKARASVASDLWRQSFEFIDESGDTADYWHAADVFVCTSRVESYPRVILEAMAHGLPIISTPVYGIAEQISPDINALVYPPKDVDLLRRHIETLSFYPEFRARLASETRHVLEGLQDFDGMLDSYEGIFRAAAFSAVPAKEMVRGGNRGRKFNVHAAYSEKKNLLQQKSIRPAFSTKNIAIVFSTNEFYIPYLGVAIYSLIKNVNANCNYDIIVLATSIPSETFSKIIALAQDLPNVSIRVYDTSTLIEAIPKSLLHVEGYVPIETYNKCFITDILSGYERCVYLDSDMLIVDDVQKLHDIDLGGCSVGASANVANIHAAYCKKNIKGQIFPDYLRAELGVLDHNKYFQAGALVLDMRKLAAMNLPKCSFEALEKVQKPIYFDQCIYNRLFYGDVKFFSTRWNHVWYMQEYSYLRGAVSDEVFFDYAAGRVNPSIIHYAGAAKPQSKLGWKLSDQFWRYANSSPFYDEIVKKILREDNEVATAIKVYDGDRWQIIRPRMLVHLHLFYIDQLESMIDALGNIDGVDVELFVTMSERNRIAETRIQSEWSSAKIYVLPNVGYDVYPFLYVLEQVQLSHYDFVLKIHTKSSRKLGQDEVYGKRIPGFKWRDDLIGALLGSREKFGENLAALRDDPSLGCIGAKDYIFDTLRNNEECNYSLDEWRARCGAVQGNHYIGGSMFMARAYPFERLKSLDLKPEDFEAQQMYTKDHKNKAHVFERLFGIVIENEGFEISGEDPAISKSTLSVRNKR